MNKFNKKMIRLFLGIVLLTAFIFPISSSSNATKSQEIRVMVIDSYLNYSLPSINKYLAHYNGDKEYLSAGGMIATHRIDNEMVLNHGTNVTNIVLYGDYRNPTPVASNVKLYFCNVSYKLQWSLTNTLYGPITITDCLKEALKLNIDIINISLSGTGKIQSEQDYIIKLLNKGSVIMLAAGNSSIDIEKSNVYPAKIHHDLVMSSRHARRNFDKDDNPYPNLKIITSLKKDGSLSDFSNRYSLAIGEKAENLLSICYYGNQCVIMGTSQAAALHTHKEILKLQKNRR